MSSHTYYAIGADDAPEGARPLTRIDGEHRWQLPRRIGCPECGVHGAIGSAYPAVDLSGWAGAAALTQPSAASWRQFQEMVRSVAPLVGEDRPLTPGTELGPFTGTVEGGPAELVLGPIHFLFATPAACARLRDAGVMLPPVVPAVVRRGRTLAALVEIEVPPAGRLADAAFEGGDPARCGTCGRSQRPLARVLLEAGSVTTAIDLLRPLNHATVVLASERFVSAVRAAELTGLTFERVGTVGADA